MLRAHQVASFVACLVIAHASVVQATEFDAAVLEQIPTRMQGFVKEQVVAGAVVVVGSSEGVAHLSAVGQLTVEPAVEMPTNAVFRIASMTKPMTALAVLQLQERGLLNVDDPVEKHLPEFRGQQLVQSRSAEQTVLVSPSRPISIRDLLTHTSGLPGGYPSGISDMYSRRHLSLAEAIYAQSQQPLEFEPGTRWSYCNAGIDTLGRIVEVVSGESFGDYMAKNVFHKLGMTDTAFPLRADLKPRLAGLYEIQNNQWKEVENPLIGELDHPRHPIPAGGLLSTAADLSKLYQCLLRGGELDGQRIIQADTLAEMTRVQTGDLTTGFVDGMSFGYGFAVVREPRTGMATEQLTAGSYGHGGAFGTQGWLDPHRDLFVVLLVQRTGLPNADNSDVRKELQRLAVEAIRR